MSGNDCDRAQQKIWNSPASNEEDIRTISGETVIKGHLNSFPDLGSRKEFSYSSLWHREGSSGQLGNSDSWEPPQSPADPRCLFPILSSSSCLFFSFTISVSVPSAEKNWQGSVPVVKWLFSPITSLPYPRHPRCSQSCVKMSELCRWYEQIWIAFIVGNLLFQQCFDSFHLDERLK